MKTFISLKNNGKDLLCYLLCVEDNGMVVLCIISCLVQQFHIYLPVSANYHLISLALSSAEATAGYPNKIAIIERRDSRFLPFFPPSPARFIFSFSPGES